MARTCWRPDDLEVIAVGEYLPTSSPVPDGERAVDIPRRRYLKALHPAAEGSLVVGLDEQMNMRLLDTDVDDADSLAKRRGDRCITQGLVQRSPSHATDGRYDPQHHVQCTSRIDRGARLVTRTRASALWLPSGSPLPALAGTREQILLRVLARSVRRRLHAPLDSHSH